MKITEKEEKKLREISAAASFLENAIEDLMRPINGDVIHSTDEPVISMFTKEGDDIELDIADLADYKPLREAFLKI